MSEGAIAESTLLKDAKYTLVKLEEDAQTENSTGANEESEEEEDFVVYSGSTELKDAPDITQKFESQPADSRATLSPSQLTPLCRFPAREG